MRVGRYTRLAWSHTGTQTIFAKMGLFRRKKQTAGKPSAPQKPVSLPQTGAPEPEQLSEQQARVMAQALSEYLKGKR